MDADQPLLDASQVNAAKALLNKVLPDLKPVDYDGESADRHIVEFVIGGE
ncbi:hypothetical protein [uncultured Roseobacter sp.]|nr:hypothetical protein [uncultured Roseobacter sp.]